MNTTEDDEKVQFIKTEMEEALELEKQQPAFTLQSLRGKSDLKPLRRLVLCFGIQMAQQWTAINVVVFYSKYLLISLHL